MIPYSKLIRSLENRKNRKKEGLFVIEGPKLLKEAFLANLGIKAVLINESEKNLDTTIVEEAKAKAPLYFVSEDEFSVFSDTVTPQGIIAIAEMPRYNLNDINLSPFFLVIDGVQDPGNLGTLFRTALASSAGGIILLKSTVDPYNSKVVRSAMGALFRLPFVTDVTIDDLKSFLKNSNAKVWAATLDEAVPYYELSPSVGTGIVIGNEGNGISNEVLNIASKKVKVPIDMRSESLNAAIAAGVLLFYLKKELAP